MEKQIKIVMDGGPEFTIGDPTEADILELDGRAKNLSKDWSEKKKEDGSNEKFAELLIMRYILKWEKLNNLVWGSLIKRELADGTKIEMLWELDKDGKKLSTTMVPFNKKNLVFLSKYPSIKFMKFYTHCQEALKEIGYEERSQELDDLKN